MHTYLMTMCTHSLDNKSITFYIAYPNWVDGQFLRFPVKEINTFCTECSVKLGLPEVFFFFFWNDSHLKCRVLLRNHCVLPCRVQGSEMIKIRGSRAGSTWQGFLALTALLLSFPPGEWNYSYWTFPLFLEVNNLHPQKQKFAGCLGGCAAGDHRDG